MSALNVATIVNNFLKVYYFEKKDKSLSGAAFFSIPIKKDLVENCRVLNLEETASLLLPQIARAKDQIKHRDLVYLIPSAEAYSFVATVSNEPTPEQIFEQAKEKVKYGFEEAAILVKEMKDGKASVYLARKGYIDMVKTVFKSDTFNLKVIVPEAEALANLTADVEGPHHILGRFGSRLVGILVNDTWVYHVEEAEYIETEDSESLEKNRGAAKKIIISLKKGAQEQGFPETETYLADKYTQALQTDQNMVKIVQIPFEEGVDSTALSMLLPTKSYTNKGVNFWYLGENSTDNKSSFREKYMGKIIIASLIVLLLGGGGVWLFLKNNAGKSLNDTNTPTPTETPVTVTIAEPTPTPTPSVVLERKNLKVQVLNGTGTTGLAAKVRTTLEEKGYVVTGTGNAASSEQTKLQLKPTKKDYFNLVQKDLEGTYTVVAGDDLTESNDADAVLTIGTQ